MRYLHKLRLIRRTLSSAALCSGMIVDREQPLASELARNICLDQSQNEARNSPIWPCSAGNWSGY